MAAVVAVVMKVLGSGAEIAGYQQAADNARLQGQRQNVERQFEAEQLEQQASQAAAAGQRRALEERRKANLLASRTLALAASSGGGASDNTVIDIIAKMKGEGAYRAGVALYQGEDEARRLRMGGKAKRYEGAMAEEEGVQLGHAYDVKASAALLDMGADLFSKKPSTMKDRYG